MTAPASPGLLQDRPQLVPPAGAGTPPPGRPSSASLSRLVQVALAAVALVLLSPILALVALAVRITSPGPVFYRGVRIGRHQRPFVLYKFRTLQVGAEQRIGARLLSDQDRLYTPIGKFLKKTKLDELPQLWNVLRGEMNLVGPRPVRPVFLDQLKREIPHYARRFEVRPGMTGLAQLRGGYWTHPRNKLRYELVYIRNQSLLLDLKLIALTGLKLSNRLLTIGAALAALFLFVSFFPASLHPWLYVTVAGTRVNLLYLLMLLAAAAVLARRTYANRLFVYRSPVYLPIAVFAAAGLVSAAVSPDPERALRGLAYHSVTGFLVALTLLNTRITAGFARSAAALAGLACGLLSLVGLLELALLRHSVLAVAGPGAAGPGGIESAIRATLASPNVLAAYLVLGFPLLLCQVTHARTRDGRDFWLVCSTVAFTSLLLTQNPLGLLALFTACAIFLAATSPRALPLLASLFLFPIVLLGIREGAAGLASVPASLAAKFRGDLATIAAAPIQQLAAGVGLKALAPARAAAVGALVPPADAGNMHLTLILETGLVGWAAMLWIFAATLRVLYRGARQARDPYQRSLLWAIFSSIVGFLVSMSGVDAFAHISLQVFFWGLVGLGCATVTHVVTRRSPFYVIWRFGDERPGDARSRHRPRPEHPSSPAPGLPREAGAAG